MSQQARFKVAYCRYILRFQYSIAKQFCYSDFINFRVGKKEIIFPIYIYILNSISSNIKQYIPIDNNQHISIDINQYLLILTKKYYIML